MGSDSKRTPKRSVTDWRMRSARARKSSPAPPPWLTSHQGLAAPNAHLALPPPLPPAQIDQLRRRQLGATGGGMGHQARMALRQAPCCVFGDDRILEEAANVAPDLGVRQLAAANAHHRFSDLTPAGFALPGTSQLPLDVRVVEHHGVAGAQAQGKPQHHIAVRLHLEEAGSIAEPAG